MFESLVAFFTVISEGFKSFTTCKERQSETDVLKTKKSKSKAVEFAEKLIFHIDKYYQVSNDRTYQKLRKSFFRYN